jgi:hypothetical protein
MQMAFCQLRYTRIARFTDSHGGNFHERLNLLWGKNDNVTSVHGHKSLTILLTGVMGAYDCDHGRGLSTGIQ